MTKKKTITFQRKPEDYPAEPPPLGRVFRGQLSENDVDLEPDLADLIQIWRVKYARFYDPSFNPDSPSVEATLRALLRTTPDDAKRAVRYLDPNTYSRLKHAAWKDYRRLHPEPAPIPRGVLGPATIAPNLQRYAELALGNLMAEPKDKGGAPRISELDRQFAVGLVSFWNRRHPDQPAAVSNPADEPNGFEAWAWEMFERAGRRANRKGGKALSEASLPSTLSRAISAVRTQAG